MPMWICGNCDGARHQETGVPARGFEFEADAPVCPQCGVDRRKGGVYAGVILEREAIHFDPPHPEMPRLRGSGVKACDGKPLGTFVTDTKLVMGSGDRLAVTCPKCKETDVFKGEAVVSDRLLRAV